MVLYDTGLQPQVPNCTQDHTAFLALLTILLVLFCWCCSCLLQLPFMTTAYELKFWGVNLKALVMQASKDFIFSEVGLGGAAPDGR